MCGLDGLLCEALSVCFFFVRCRFAQDRVSVAGRPLIVHTLSFHDSDVPRAPWC